MKRVCAALLLICAMIATPAMSKTKKSKVENYTLPGTELVKGEKSGNIRAWGVGTADTETAARMLAMKNASSDLAEMVKKTVEITLTNCNIIESTGEAVSSKEILSKELQIFANQQLSGAVVIFDSWEPKNSDGMYKNYIVLELKGDKFIDKLYNDYKASGKEMKISREEFEAAFYSRSEEE